MDKIAVKYDECYNAAHRLDIISKEINKEIVFINEIISDFTNLTREYSIVNIEIDELYVLRQNLIGESERVSILSNEMKKYVEKVKDLDKRLESKIDKGFDDYFRSKLEFKDHPEDKYRVIGGTYLYPDKDPSFGFGDLENLDLINDSSSLFYLDFIKRRIAYEKNKNRLEALKLSKNKYEIDYKEMQEANSIFKKGLYFFKYSFDRTFGLYGETQADFLKIQGKDPELADLAGDFSSGIMLEPFIVLGANATIFRGISSDSVVAGSGLGPLKGKIKGAKSAEEVSNPIQSNYVLFNKTHKGSAPVPKGTGPNGGRLQSHHGLQQQWAKENLSQYGYDPDLASTVTIETGKGMPHTSISTAQNARRNSRVASGNGKWSSSLQDELGYLVDDFINAGFSKDTINSVLEQQYKMLDKLKVPYERIDIR